VAGARPGLQNRGMESTSPISHKKLRNQAPPLTAQGQRAESNDPDLAALIEAWDRLPEAIKAGIVAMVGATLNSSVPSEIGSGTNV
jgi:hypothetical protein